MKKIMIVDNHPVMLQFMKMLMEKEGHQVTAAKDGLVALANLKTFVPDVIFLDLVMPNITGEKLCRILRSMPELNKTLIVIISAIAAEGDIHFKKLGADACIAKGPFDRMSGYILDVLDQMDKETFRELSSEIIGLSESHSREITKELLHAKRHSDLILDNMSEGIFELNPEGRVIYVNPAAVTLTNLKEEEVLGVYYYNLFDDTDRLRIRKDMDRINEDTQKVIRITPSSLNGRQVTMSILPVLSNKDKSIVVIANDVTEENRLEAQLQRAQKMEAIGILAGGVAHDLNNVLSGIVSYPELLLLDIEESNPLRKPIETIRKSGERAAAIVQDLLVMARRGTLISEVVDLNKIISEYLVTPEYEKLLSFHPEVRIETNLDPQLLSIMGSPVHLAKAVMNLVANAAEAMPWGGEITISTENSYVDEPIKGYDNVNEGEYVLVTVSDMGTGISLEDMERIFEPFYTKKVMGRSGTGLGLAVLWGTVKDHRGYIDVKSTEKNGTSFKLYFPVSRLEASIEVPLFSIDDYRGNGEAILVVDDVQLQREIASSILVRLGYTVTSVSSGEEAVEYLRDHSVDLVVLDMIMDPGIDGLETYKRVHELHPGQKAVITSGFSETDNVRELKRLGVASYIKKPYTLERMGQAIVDELSKV